MNQSQIPSSAYLHSFFLGIFAYSILIMGYLSSSLVFSSITLIYFYYSVFTLWHELVHAPTSKTSVYLNNILGTIAISPLLIHNYQDKKIMHLAHHQYTNNPQKDPDYSANNFEVSSIRRIFRPQKSINASGSIAFIDVIAKTIFTLFIFAWVLKYNLLSFLICALISYCLTHAIVNVYPHFRSFELSRDLGGPFIITLLLLGNNYHASHHKYPSLPWSYFLKNASKN